MSMRAGRICRTTRIDRLGTPLQVGIDIDAYMWAIMPDTNFGTTNVIGLGMPGGNAARPVMEKDLSVLDLSCLSDAYLCFSVALVSGGGGACRLHRVDPDGALTFVGDEVTYNDRDSSTAWGTAGGDLTTPTVDFTMPSATGVLRIRVYDLVKDARDNRSGLFSVIAKLVTESGTDGILIASSDHATLAGPWLELWI